MTLSSTAAATSLPETYDPLNEQVKQNPYPYYAMMRASEPVKYLPHMDTYAVATYEGVDKVLKDHKLFSSQHFWPELLGEYDPVPEVPPMISMDPPNHVHLRKLANKAFMPSKVAALEERARAIATELVEGLVAKYGNEGEFDWVWEFTALYPVTVICEVLGVPTERRAEFKVWVDDLLGAANRHAYGPERLAEIRKHSNELRQFFEELYDLRKQDPQDDLISTFITAEVNGETMSRLEVLQMATLLLIGGVETTTNLLGCTMVELRRHPDIYARVQADHSLIPPLLEETLRFNPVVQMLFRHTIEDTELCGVKIPKGKAVMPLLGSANRDASKYANADVFDIDRKPEAPMMSFGQGPHFCLGSFLARMEARVALEVVFSRLEQVEPIAEADEVVWLDSYFARGPQTLPVRFKAR